MTGWRPEDGPLPALLGPTLRRSQRIPGDLGPNRLTLALRALRGKSAIIDLCRSNPTEVGLAPAPEAVRHAYRRVGSLGYRPDPLGLPAAREALAEALREDLGRVIDPEALVLAASTSEAYSLIFRAVANPGDRVALPSPSYPLFGQLLNLDGLLAAPYALRPAAGAWHLDALAPPGGGPGGEIAALIAVHPNNPTGSYLSTSEAERLKAWAAGARRPLIVDEVFEPYPLERPPDAAPSFFRPEAAGEATVLALGGLSKALCLPQAKLAWIHLGGPPEARRHLLEALEYAADATLSVGAAVQDALPDLLALRHEVQARVLDRLRENLDTLDARLHGSPISRRRVEGGWYAILRLPATRSCEGWALHLLEAAHVLAHPGYLFDLPGASDVVVSLIVPPEEMAEGARRIVALADP